jgi:hypothetical protein
MSVCRECGREWHGFSECHCMECHEHFKSVAAFDKHRVNDPVNGRRCLTPEEMRKRGMAASGGKWVTASRSDTSYLPSRDKNPAFSASTPTQDTPEGQEGAERAENRIPDADEGGSPPGLGHGAPV